MFYICRSKLGYSKFEAEHIYFGEYLEQFEVYKKYHNFEMNKMVFSEQEEEEKTKEEPPAWVLEAERKINGI